MTDAERERYAATLLPCPFCGRPPLVEPLDPKIDGSAWTRISCQNPRCKVELEARAYDDRVYVHRRKAKAVWNRRWQARAALDAVPEGLRDRIRAAEQRIIDGHALRRIPADPTDVDLVLAEVADWIDGKWPPFWIKAAPSPTAGGEE